MNLGIHLATLVALVGSSSCRHVPDTGQLATLDSTITAVEAASLTLNELGTRQFIAADSIFNATRPLFMQRFEDTLDRPTATLLGDQFVQLRHTAMMHSEQDRIQTEVERTMVRLQALRNDLVQGAIDKEAGDRAVKNEKAAYTLLNSEVLRMLENHTTTQRVLQRQALVDSLLVAPETLQPNR